MPPSLSIFDIPHILAAITADLTFTELQSCVLVSRTWHRTFIPDLWKEFYSYRSYPRCKNNCESTKYEPIFTTLNDLSIVRRYCRHIRSLSVRGSNMLQVLARADYCINLSEIQYSPNHPNATMDLGFQDLLELMDLNPYLYALRLVHIQIVTQRDQQCTRNFVASLCENYPHLQKVVFETTAPIDADLALEIVVKLARFKDTVSVKVGRIVFQDNDGDNEDYDDNYGKENEQGAKELEPTQGNTTLQRIRSLINSVDTFRVQDLTILQSLSQGHVASHYPQLVNILFRHRGDFQKYPRLERISLQDLPNVNCSILPPQQPTPLLATMSSFPLFFSHVQHLDIDNLRSKTNSMSFTDIFRACQTPLVSIRLGTHGWRDDSQTVLEERHGETLRSLILNVTARWGDPVNICSLLSRCPRLETFKTEFSHVSYQQVWYNWDLYVFEQHTYLTSLTLLVSMYPNVWNGESPTIQQSREGEQKFFKAIGKLCGLKHLSILEHRFHWTGLKHGRGLEHLGGLKQLETLEFHSIKGHPMAEQDLQWMVDQLPMLKSFTERVSSSHVGVSICIDEEKGILRLRRSIFCVAYSSRSKRSSSSTSSTCSTSSASIIRITGSSDQTSRATEQYLDPRPVVAYHPVRSKKREICHLCCEDVDDRWKARLQSKEMKQQEQYELYEEEYLRSWKGRL